MDSTYSVTQAQTNLPRLIKEAAAEGSIAITRHEETVAYLISRGRMDAIVETLDLLGNPAAIKALRDDEQGKTKFLLRPTKFFRDTYYSDLPIVRRSRPARCH